MNIAALLEYLQQPDIQKIPMAPENSALRTLIRQMGVGMQPMYEKTPRMGTTLKDLFPNGKYIEPDDLMRIDRLKRQGKIEWDM